MDELHHSLNGMLVSDFRYIRAINSGGCHKLKMNVATLEQILALISSNATIELDTARQFYELVAAGPEKLVGLAPTLGHHFTMQQYQSIFDVYYHENGGGSGDTGLRKTYANQLVRLKYLFEEKENQ